LESSFFLRSATRSAWILEARAAMLSAVDLSLVDFSAAAVDELDFLLLRKSSQLKLENDDLELLPVDLFFLVLEVDGVYELYLEKLYC